MNIQLRLEMENDYKQTENLTREAFWDLYKPGCVEHLILRKIRQVRAFVKELDFVAVYDNQIVGNIIYSKAKVINDNSVDSIILVTSPYHQRRAYTEFKKTLGKDFNRDF